MPGHHIGGEKNNLEKDILSVTIIGGSISGLACAFALAKARHRVTVLEATDGRNTRCGAIKLPPNGTLCLNRWGLKTLLEKYSQKFLKYSFMHTEHDGLVGTLQLNELLQHEAFLNQDVSDYTFSLDSDLWNWLFKLATDSGVAFRPNSRVVDIDSSKPAVTLQNGDVVVSDFIVGADGINGIARSLVSGRSLDTNGPRFLTAACTLPCDGFHRDPDLVSLLNETIWLIWGGDGVRLQGQVGQGAKTYTLTLEYQIPDDVTLDPSMKIFGWCDTFKLEDLEFVDYTKFSGRALKLLNLAKGARAFMNIYVEQPVLDELVCDNERVVLVGDAAHGIAPANQHNAALGLEDAEALGYLFTRIQSRAYVPRFIMAFEEIRGPRVAHGSKVDISLKYSHMLPEGPLRDRFDEFFAAAAERAADQLDEEYLSLLWNDTLSMWLYDASEKVEDWLTKWGTGMTREFRENDTRATLVFIDRNISHQ